MHNLKLHNIDHIYIQVIMKHIYHLYAHYLRSEKKRSHNTGKFMTVEGRRLKNNFGNCETYFAE